MWTAAVFILVIAVAVIAQACTVGRADRLYSTLPPEIDGQTLTRSETSLGSLSGLPIDDVVARLDRTRGDTTWVVGTVPGKLSVDALEVSRVTEDQLLSAVVDTWANGAVIGREATNVGGFRVVKLEQRDGSAAYVYGSRGAAYVVTLPARGDEALVGALLAGIRN